MEKSSRKALPSSNHNTRSFRSRRAIIVAILLFNVACLLRTWAFQNVKSGPDIAQVQRCAIDNLQADLSFLDGASPIGKSEFIERRDRLARALVASDVDAFVVEPGYTFQYYGNTSQSDWEPWEPEERPFLMIILPVRSESGAVSAKTAFLAPHFEEGRVRMLEIPSQEPELDIVIWEEHWDPYSTLRQSHLFADSGMHEHARKPRLIVDEELRDFIARGLANAGFETFGLSAEVELVRQLKSPAEVELLRAVNTGTVAAVRAMRPCLVAGLTEDEVRDILDASLLSVGFTLFFNIVLFEEDGALPHGGFVVGKKKLNHETMIVIDVGAHYLGYSSDICRSFFIDPEAEKGKTYTSSIASLLMRMDLLPRSIQVPKGNSKLYAEKLKVWDVVLDAQTAASKKFKANNTAASVDIAARKIIEDAGYDHAFTHRLGHGIGIKAHESPYLNKWNTKSILQPGMTFTNEPGIYLEGKFGVRHEDIYLVKEDGDAELLTGRRATGPYDP
ncbi:Prolidase/Aminopeptidase P-like protein [Daldinia decipiens]|uniref:Prolidase/Aminopeptidase P-like protein n=1 Tax=Daldinia decipiens TaxID=326647 RepID=UPI0020C423C3|nr:Prolidase/Aminopeptidase P-like protein [Daldinia decipiens]KAI1653939.1 Prolidase/Aminopeptidase P-like protein [Daldinia decipiens]